MKLKVEQIIGKVQSMAAQKLMCNAEDLDLTGSCKSTLLAGTITLFTARFRNKNSGQNISITHAAYTNKTI